MAQHWWDWSSYTLGNDIVDDEDWSFRGALPGTDDFPIVSATDAPAGVAAQTQGVGSGTSLFTVPDDLSALTASQGEVYIEFQAQTSDEQLEFNVGGAGFLAGGVGDQDADLDGYYGHSTGAINGPRPEIERVESGTHTRLARMALQSGTELDEPWAQRFQWNDSGGSVSLKWRYWKRADSEPATWDLETTDSNLSGSPGAIGLFTVMAAEVTTYLAVGVGTDGDPAPTSDPGGGGGGGLSIQVAMRLYRGFRTISIAILALILV